MYSPDLEYTQLNGVTIGWRKLASDVRKQLKAITSFKTSTSREVLEVSGDDVMETSTQEAVIAVRVFWRITKKWNLLRRSKVWWIRTDDGWKINKVVVLEESVV